ncbi:hypothetical protein ACJMK2_000267, partial [Sinanodonta woodiana]
MDNLDMSKLPQLQNDDTVLKVVKEMVTSKKKYEWSDISHYCPEIKYYWKQVDSFVVEDDILYRKWESDDGMTVTKQI